MFAHAGVKKRYSLLSGYNLFYLYCFVGIDMLLIITSNGDKLFSGINIDDLEQS